MAVHTLPVQLSAKLCGRVGGQASSSSSLWFCSIQNYSPPLLVGLNREGIKLLSNYVNKVVIILAHSILNVVSVYCTAKRDAYYHALCR